MVTLKMTDQTSGGEVLNEVEVSFENTLTTVKEIIKARVLAEVEAYNNRMPEYFRGLVQPTDAEKTLNGFKLKVHRKLDPEQQCLTALDAFKHNGYFVLIDNLQAKSLDQMVVINSLTTVSFIKLTQLVGG